MPLAKIFNEHIAMDLKDIGSKKIIHLVDHATKYSASCIIKSKRKEVIMDCLFKIQIKIFGEPQKFLVDNGSKKIIDLVDHATKFSAATVIPSKKRGVIIDAVLKIWVSIFGSPKKILSDNGGEFTNDDFAEMAEKLNTKITTTAAESPWSNFLQKQH